MSPSETETTFPMQIRIASGNTLENGEIRVQVFDHQDRRVHKGHGDQQVGLPPGIYTVRAEFAGQWRDEVVRHAAAGTEVGLVLPERPSAVPVYGTSTVHEYYSEPSRQISSKLGPGNSGLFLFLRAHDRESAGGAAMWDGLYLLDERGKRVLAFGPANGEENREYGFYGAALPLSPGMYILHVKGDLPREMPLYVFPEWQTQLFVFYRERPLFESASVLMSRWGAGFNPDDRVTDAIDMALRGLQSGVEVLPNRAMDVLLMGKFDNPMLGLLGAHFLLRREQPDMGLLNTVLYNLDYLLPGSPDVAALALMAEAKFGLGVDFGRPALPPMLRPALDALYDLSSRGDRYADLIQPGSLLESVAPRRYIDSVYTSWKPEKRVRSSGEADPWVVEYLRKQKLAAEASGTEVDLQTAARRLNLPLRMVEAAWEAASGRLPPQGVPAGAP